MEYCKKILRQRSKVYENFERKQINAGQGGEEIWIFKLQKW